MPSERWTVKTSSRHYSRVIGFNATYWNGTGNYHLSLQAQFFRLYGTATHTFQILKKLWVMGQHPLTHDPCDPSNNGDPWPTDPSPTLGRGPSPPRPLLTVPNVTPHPSTASVPVFLYDGPLLCVFNVPVEGLMLMHRQNVMHYILRLIYSPNCKQHYL